MTDTSTAPGAGAWVMGRELCEAYERYLVQELFEPWGRQLVQLAYPAPGERVLDVACGTGIVARLVHPMVTEEGGVSGVDVHPDILSVARDLGSTLRPAIDWRQASAVSLPLPDEASAWCSGGRAFSSSITGPGAWGRCPGSRVPAAGWR